MTEGKLSIEELEAEFFAAFPVPHVMPMDEYLASMLGIEEDSPA